MANKTYSLKADFTASNKTGRVFATVERRLERLIDRADKLDGKKIKMTVEIKNLEENVAQLEALEGAAKKSTRNRSGKVKVDGAAKSTAELARLERQAKAIGNMDVEGTAKLSTKDADKKLKWMEARLRKFDKDIWSAELTVDDDDGRARIEEFRTELKRVSDIVAKSRVDVDNKAGMEKAAALEAKLVQLEKDREVRIKAKGIEKLGVQFDSLQRQLIQLSAHPTDIDLQGNFKDVMAKVKVVQSELNEFTRKTYVLEMKAKALGVPEAAKDFAMLRAEAEALAKQRVSILTEAKGVPKALAELNILKMELKNVDGTYEVKIRVDSSAIAGGMLKAFIADLGSVSTGALKAATSFSTFTSAIRLVYPLLTALAVVFIALGAAAAGPLVAGLSIALTSLMALAGGFGLIMMAAAPLISAFGNQAENATKLKTAQDGLKTASTQLATAQDGVAAAEQNAASVRRQGIESIRSAIDAHKQSLQAVESAQEGVTQAEIAHTAATKEAKMAVQDYNNALATEKYRIQDLKYEIQGFALDEKELALDIADARKELEDAEGMEERQRAQIALDRLLLREKQLTNDQRDAQLALNDARKHGTDELQSAFEAKQQAQQAEKEAAQASIDAQNELTTALKNEKRARGDIQRARAEADRNNAQAQKDIVTAMEAVADAAEEVAAKQKEVNALMAAASPIIKNLQAAVGRFKKGYHVAFDDATRMTSDLGVQLIDIGTNLLPQMGLAAEHSLMGFDLALDAIKKNFAQNGVLESFNEILAETPGITRLWTESIGNFAGGFLNFMAEAMPYAKDFAHYVNLLSERFLSWTASEDGRKALQTFFESAGPIASVLAKHIANIASDLVKWGSKEGNVEKVAMAIDDMLTAMTWMVKTGAKIIGFLYRFGKAHPWIAKVVGSLMLLRLLGFKHIFTLVKLLGKLGGTALLKKAAGGIAGLGGAFLGMGNKAEGARKKINATSQAANKGTGRFRKMNDETKKTSQNMGAVDKNTDKANKSTASYGNTAQNASKKTGLFSGALRAVGAFFTSNKVAQGIKSFGTKIRNMSVGKWIADAFKKVNMKGITGFFSRIGAMGGARLLFGFARAMISWPVFLADILTGGAITEGIFKFFGDFYTGWKKGWQENKPLLTNLFRAGWLSLWDAFNFSSIATKFMKGFREGFANADVKNHQLKLAKGVIDGILLGMEELPIVGPILKWTKNFLTTILDAFGIKSPSTKTKPMGKNLALGIIEGFTAVDIAAKIGKHVITAFRSVGKTAGNLWGDLKEKAGSIWGDIADTIGRNSDKAKESSNKNSRIMKETAVTNANQHAQQVGLHLGNMKEDVSKHTDNMKRASNDNSENMRKTGNENAKDQRQTSGNWFYELRQKVGEHTWDAMKASGRNTLSMREEGVQNAKDLKTWALKAMWEWYRGVDGSTSDARDKSTTHTQTMQENVAQNARDLAKWSTKAIVEATEKWVNSIRDGVINANEYMGKDLIEGVKKVVDQLGLDLEVVVQSLPVVGPIYSAAKWLFSAAGNVVEFARGGSHKGADVAPIGGVAKGTTRVHGEVPGTTEFYVTDNPMHEDRNMNILRQANEHMHDKYGKWAMSYGEGSGNHPEARKKKYGYKKSRLMPEPMEEVFAASGLVLGVPGGSVMATFQQYIPGYSFSSDSRHKGVDVGQATGTPIYAPVTGRVLANEGPGVGGYNNAVQTTYFTKDRKQVYLTSGHLGTGTGAPTGSTVGPNTKIGAIGTSYDAAGTPPHVHHQAYSSNTMYGEAGIFDPFDLWAMVGGSTETPPPGAGGGATIDYGAIIAELIPKPPAFAGQREGKIKEIFKKGTGNVYDSTMTMLNALAPTGVGTGDVTSSPMSSAQKDVANWMADEAVKRQIPDVLPVMTAIVESNLQNLDYGDSDSVGYFQQRPSQGWGTVEQLTNPQYALDAFLDAAEGVRREVSWTDAAGLGSWAQDVQRSAYPERYAGAYPAARDLVGPVPKGYSHGGLALQPHVGIVGERGGRVGEAMVPLDDPRAVRAISRAFDRSKPASESSGDNSVSRVRSVADSSRSFYNSEPNSSNRFGSVTTSSVTDGGMSGASVDEKLERIHSKLDNIGFNEDAIAKLVELQVKAALATILSKGGADAIDETMGEKLKYDFTLKGLRK